MTSMPTGFEPTAVNRNWYRAKAKDWTGVLADVPLFSQLRKRQLRKLVQRARFSGFSPGETVVQMGEPGDAFHVILDGCAAVAGKGDSTCLGVGDSFGELALIDGKGRSATVVATGELQTMNLPRGAFLDVLDRPTVARPLLEELGARVRRLESMDSR